MWLSREYEGDEGGGERVGVDVPVVGRMTEWNPAESWGGGGMERG